MPDIYHLQLTHRFSNLIIFNPTLWVKFNLITQLNFEIPVTKEWYLHFNAARKFQDPQPTEILRHTI